MLDIQVWFGTALEVQESYFREVMHTAETELEIVEAELAVGAALYASEISPRWTGALSSSHIVEQEADMTIVFINPSVFNPITGDAVEDYGPDVHERDAKSAFYTRTVKEAGPRLMQEAGDDFITRLEAFSN